ncbi:TPA: helix-turn-helix domain-containing protein [Staphylococcus pseudintermedius]|uniref:helix-turn-helix domain-containing protein n=1 Tax=Staphylococcus pseudintermedius TaxID=283734 RepID=UPI0019325DD0|nr:helix-turn-helix transcriptional regulator [Staphylococcus pseudintermedius]EGQ0358828.1 helix-turn-helix transcriptional regulator [Staphylococcus pseudintermedius]EGQ1613600.1 helix-turn-helix transcriptional regulator [Staphylococcus pseudintermedius]EGQ2696393.1 helix-turn-helix transcriptional regulator [Staphylococcus pseudintermedius]EGQ2844121.1 helix-turn-helix transcriptional regulator [Staphylococcus pseudintermedius]EGQ3162928.1 helix-turn-helix transcriptional regulator [Staphy
MRSNDEIISILKVAMDEKNLSLSELARRAGVAKSAVSRYLNLTREFPLNRAEDFAKALGISTEYLLGFNKSEQQDNLAAHLDGDDFSEEELAKIREFAEMVRKSRDK